MSIDDTIQIFCPKCRSKFRDRARRIVSGYSRQCPSCERVIFFEGGPRIEIREALSEAKRVREAMRDEKAAEKVALQSTAPADQPDDDVAGDADDSPSLSRRQAAQLIRTRKVV
jgi:hypothetical protein